MTLNRCGVILSFFFFLFLVMVVVGFDHSLDGQSVQFILVHTCTMHFMHLSTHPSSSSSFCSFAFVYNHIRHLVYHFFFFFFCWWPDLNFRNCVRVCVLYRFSSRSVAFLCSLFNLCPPPTVVVVLFQDKNEFKPFSFISFELNRTQKPGESAYTHSYLFLLLFWIKLTIAHGTLSLLILISKWYQKLHQLFFFFFFKSDS